ncbi:MAG: hypothetical protein AAB875_07015 [Patescibacteria group bacterium]
MAVIAFDVDGVICETSGTDYENAVPKKENIARINALFEAGHKIIIFTGRGTASKIDWRPLTERQFAEWNLKYHELMFGKPNFDCFYDDKAWNVVDFEKENTLKGIKQTLCRELDRFIEDSGNVKPYQLYTMIQTLSLAYMQKMESLEAERCLVFMAKMS